MFSSTPEPHPVCTISRHPEGGFTPVLHLSNRAAPEVSRHGISLPTPADVKRYARSHYGAVPIRLPDESGRTSAA